MAGRRTSIGSTGSLCLAALFKYIRGTKYQLPLFLNSLARNWAAAQSKLLFALLRVRVVDLPWYTLAALRLDARRLDAYFDLGAHATASTIVVTGADREQSVLFVFYSFFFFSLSLSLFLSLFL